MLSLFPGILYLAPFGIFALRTIAGLYFMYIGWRVYVTRERIEEVRVPIVGHIKGWMLWFSIIVAFAVGVLLFIGLWTQAAAIVGMLAMLKHIYGARNYADIMPLAAGTCFLLFVICFALLLGGAGPIAFDLPL